MRTATAVQTVQHPESVPIAFSSSSRRPLLLESQLALHLLANQVFLHPARHGQREGLYKLDIARNFVVGDLPLTEASHAMLIERHAFAQNDPRAQLLT